MTKRENNSVNSREQTLPVAVGGNRKLYTDKSLLFVFQQATQIDNDLKARASAYNNLKGNLQNLERKNA